MQKKISVMLKDEKGRVYRREVVKIENKFTKMQEIACKLDGLIENHSRQFLGFSPTMGFDLTIGFVPNSAKSKNDIDEFCLFLDQELGIMLMDGVLKEHIRAGCRVRRYSGNVEVYYSNEVVSKCQLITKDSVETDYVDLVC